MFVLKFFEAINQYTWIQVCGIDVSRLMEQIQVG